MSRFLLSVRSRLWLGFGLMLALVVLAAGGGILAAQDASTKTGSMIDRQLAELMAAKTAESEALAARVAEQRFLRRPSDELAARVAASMNNAGQAMEKVKQHSADPAHAEQAAAGKALADKYVALFAEVTALTKRRGFTPEEGLQGELRAAVHGIEKAVNDQGLAELSVLMLMCRRHEKDYMLRGDAKYLTEIDKRIEEFKKQMTMFSMDAELQGKIGALWTSYSTAIRSLAEIDKSITAKVEEFGAVAAELDRNATEIAAAANNDLGSRASAVRSRLDLSRTALAGLLGVSALFACVIAWLTTGSLCRPIASLNARVRDIAEGEGDLTQRVEVLRRDELGELAKWFNAFVEKIEHVVSQVKAGAAQIDAGGSQIASASQSLAQGASEQASSLQQISAAIEEMSGQTRQSAENARQANALAEESKKSADRGQQEMAQMTKAVDEIKQSSSEISKIIKVIDEIAFQTNLLALNAAVEAARAGEAGKGFAVVAEEVRNLAQRSAEAAKSTASMIEESVRRSENGVQIAARVGQALEEIATSTNKVNTLLSEIASAAGEQATGIGQMNQGVSQLDQVTQQSAGNSEEMASSAEELSAQVASLNELVAQFKVSGGSGHAALQCRAPAARSTAPMQPAKELIKQAGGAPTRAGSPDNDEILASV